MKHIPKEKQCFTINALFKSTFWCHRYGSSFNAWMRNICLYMAEINLNSCLLYFKHLKFLIPSLNSHFKSRYTVCVSRSVVSNSLQTHDLYSLPGFSVQGILQARILKWIAIPFSRGSSWPTDQTQVSCIAGRFFIIWAIGKISDTLE